MSLFMSLVGMAVLLGIALLLSDNRKAINLRTVGGAFAIQFIIGGFVLYVPWGRDLLAGFSAGVQNVIDYGKDGTGFLFGSLVNFSVDGIGFIFAFQVLPTLIFFSALISVLYYVGVMQWVIKILGGGLQKALGTSRAESMSAAANIFVGQTEAPLVVRPFVPKMTQSELFAVMCGGLASVAGGVLAGYASMGVPLEYLVAASFMAAPGGLLFAKIIKPETDAPDEELGADIDGGDDKPANVIDAAAGGASVGLQLALNVGAMLLAFIGLIALINGILGGVGGWFGMPELTLEILLGYIFSPLAFLIGVPWEEATLAGSFIGQKLVVNEFVAYLNFVPYVGEAAQVVPATGEVMSTKTAAIISFALCGFANLSSIAILLGGLGGLAPNRRHDIARMGVKAVCAGTLSNLMAATIAGFFLSF
ncbi:nucleoside transporter NupC [Vibrio coralliilyticus]|jgi:CNT family concentrative nucleoside transporter|uniref:Nucleoside permease n=1 Tax=Vibrio coralliilyticus TaxID=190893 RepID=A0A097AVM3_9VIBR|nr:MULTISPECIES: NupC/NupG family nucleoside CNT transporter [Vibrio]AIS53980.1 nucleoside transporter NupC [Vibrio coralliilyticus]ANW24889.1 nucleoside transporter NupC [Vibrio coralliilyticus]AXN31412.1 NupC/NupG family nucleoside CNT transporter [Vibrio coralliilyticus]ERB63265.1 nucleoside transporter NupC [Vibrio coralliilyticus OCN008]KFI10252.1 nucleoside transporter NupC [Vibrio sp. B183]